MALEKSERYICIGIDEDLKDAQIISFIRSYTNKLDKLCKQYPKSYRHVSDQFDDDNELIGKEFICDKRLVSFRAPKETKEMSVEEKKAVTDRLQKARKPREKKPIT
jgi:hypothetical protein